MNKTVIFKKYAISGIVKQEHLDRLMNILNRLESDLRLQQEDLVWISTEGEMYFSDKIRAASDLLEAKHQALVDAQILREKYDIRCGIKESHLDWLMSILNRFESGLRLENKDYVWLMSEGEHYYYYYYSKKLRTTYHQLEASFFDSEFRRTNDPWKAVNASSHYRKCDRAGDAVSLLNSIQIEQQKSSKLKSALCTTKGGALRDLESWGAALSLGEKAHEFSPDDYRPCTLLGAIHMETGNHSLGQEWYDKAVERGAPTDLIDRELRNVFSRLNQDKQIAMRDFLLGVDPVRFEWAKKIKKPVSRAI